MHIKTMKINIKIIGGFNIKFRPQPIFFVNNVRICPTKLRKLHCFFRLGGGEDI